MSEDADERQQRQMGELLQELRVALPGVQILFGFLLTVPFSQGFQKATTLQKNVYMATLLLAALSTACFIAPSAAHRIRFHQGDRRWIIETASKLAIAGLAFLALAMVGAIVVVTDFLFGPPAVFIWPVLVCVVFFGLWFVRPLLRHAGDD
jgi:Family of unknown function (DUF6328)